MIPLFSNLLDQATRTSNNYRHCASRCELEGLPLLNPATGHCGKARGNIVLLAYLYICGIAEVTVFVIIKYIFEQAENFTSVP